MNKPRDFLAEAEAELAHLDEYHGVRVPEAKKALWRRGIALASTAVGAVWGGVVRPVLGTVLLGVGFVGAVAMVPMIIAVTLHVPLNWLVGLAGFEDDGHGGGERRDIRGVGIVTLAFLWAGWVVIGSGQSSIEPVAAPTPAAVAALPVLPDKPVVVPTKTYPWSLVEEAIARGSQKWYGGKSCTGFKRGESFVLEHDPAGVTLLFGNDVYRVVSVHVDDARSFNDLLILHSFALRRHSDATWSGHMYASRAACLIAQPAQPARPAGVLGEKHGRLVAIVC